MTYEEGVKYMVFLSEKLSATNPVGEFSYGKLTISYPGYKAVGDYKLTLNGKAPSHESIVRAVYRFVTVENSNRVIDALEDIYKNGLTATTQVFTQGTKELFYWVTLQEEINYPQPKYFGRKLPFQRFFEAVLAKLKVCSLELVVRRTNNHRAGKPKLFEGFTQKVPAFYSYN